MAPADKDQVQVASRISVDLAKEIDAIRITKSADGTPEGGPPISVIVRVALTAWVAEQKKLLRK